MKKISIFVVLIFLTLACSPLPPGREAEEEAPTPTLALSTVVSETDGEVEREATPQLLSTETDEVTPEPGQMTEKSASGQSDASPEPAVVDKWDLWVNGPHLRGANIWQAVVIPELDGLEFKGDGRVGPPYTQEDFNRLAAMGANYVSISGPGLFTETSPYTVDPGVEAHLDNLLAMIAEADMFATIGFRTGPGRSEFGLCCGGDSYFEGYFNDTVWEDQAAQDAWVEMWRYTAERYRDNPIVAGYKLMVEPNSSGVFFDIYDPDEFYAEYAGTLYDWNQFYPRLVAGIREVDAGTPILVGGNGWSGVAWLPWLQPTDDPRTVYIAHQYEPQDDYTHQGPDGSNSYPGVWDADYDGEDDQFDRTWLDNLLSTVDEFKSTHGAPVAVDEYGVNRWVPGAAEFMDDQMALFEQRGMNQALWEWQTSWQPFADDVNDMTYRFGPDPDNRAEVPNDLMDVIKQYWARNAIRPSTLAAAAVPSPESPSTTSAPTGGNWWQPAVDTTWQWQLDQAIDQSFDAAMYDIDLFDVDASVVDALHAQGRKVICYISVGSWEEWRPDGDKFPASVIGEDYGGWPGEKWLDIRQIELLAPIMRARLDECQARGFDGIEPDNIDGYTNDTGFPLTYEDQLDYNIWLANEAHARGLSIGLKNDPEQVADLLPYFDWALTEDCFAEGWCEEMLPFIEAGKPVFAAEYTDTGITTDQFCPQAQKMNISAILKNRDLDAYREACGEVLGRVHQPAPGRQLMLPRLAFTFAYETRPDEAVRLTDPPPDVSDQNPAFSPDGAQLLFTRFENGYNEGPSTLNLLDLNRGDISLLTGAPDSDSVNLPGSSWNAAAGRITFASDREDIDEVWTMAADGSDLFRVTDHAPALNQAEEMAGYFLEPSFSPDGQWIRVNSQ